MGWLGSTLEGQIPRWSELSKTTLDREFCHGPVGFYAVMIEFVTFHIWCVIETRFEDSKDRKTIQKFEYQLGQWEELLNYSPRRRPYRKDRKSIQRPQECNPVGQAPANAAASSKSMTSKPSPPSTPLPLPDSAR